MAGRSDICDTDLSSEKIIDLLRSRQKTEREHGLAILQNLVRFAIDEGHSQDKALVDKCSTALVELERLIVQTLQTVSHVDSSIRCDDNGAVEGVNSGGETDWEAKHGCLSASLIIVMRTACSNSKETCDFLSELQDITLRLICDQDVRVRLLAGDILGALSKRMGPSVYESCREVVRSIMASELRSSMSGEDDESLQGVDMETDGDDTSIEVPAISTFTKQPNSFPPSSFDKITVFEASPKGVRSSKMETVLKCLINIVNAIGPQFKVFVDDEFVDAILNSLQHPNRFCRESGFLLCSVLLDSGCVDYDLYGMIFADKLSSGLTDLCSQTRIAAAIATRKHILGVQMSKREQFYDVILPRLCLCRYFMADTKFLLYSQESWRLIVNTSGPQLVEKYIDKVVSYYLDATGSENHAVREAACACIAELSRKINPVVVRPYIPVLLEALKRSFHDERWHVRDSACLGCGNFIMNFPMECKPEVENLLPLFYENLGFPISIVRQGAAASVANTIRAYGMDIIPSIIERILFGLENVNRQLPDLCCGQMSALTISPETRYSYPPGPWAQFIPYARPSQPWEFGDGCLYLIGDISPIPECQPHLSTLIPQIIRAGSIRSYSQHVIFLETLCKIVPPLTKGIGKRPFKEFLALFFEPIFYSIECENPQTAAAAKLCLQQLAMIYGPNILKSRIDQFDSRFVHYVEGC